MNCPACTHEIPADLDRCPHCARPAHFPNVRQVAQPAEIDAVEQRYRHAVAEAAGRGCAGPAHAFESAVATSRAVIGRSFEEAHRLATADNQGYAPFWKLLHAGVRLPDADRWNRLRGQADTELFGQFRDHIRFAALSLDGACLAHYGAVSLELKEDMIAHRATVFEENSAVFFERKRQRGEEPPAIAGHRARWDDRGKLALAKHEPELTPTSAPGEFTSMLLRSGATSAEDVFIEVHVYGSLTRRSLARVVVDVDAAQASPAMVVDLRDRLLAINIPVEER